MARCNDSTCSCVVRGGQGVAVLGAGTPQSPYVVNIDQSGRLSIVDSPTIDLSLTGSGTSADPSVLRADLIAHLGDLADVAKGTPPTGQVLAWTGTQWAPVPPATAAPGAVVVSSGLTGDGSVGAPLKAVVDPTAGLTVGALGIGLSAATQTRLTNLETQKLTPQYLRVERDDPYTVINNTWGRPGAFNLGATKVVGNRLSYADGYITALDTGVYQWEVTCIWAGLGAMSAISTKAVAIQINDVTKKYGQRTENFPTESYGSHRLSYSGTVPMNANDKARPAFFQENPSAASTTVTPEAFTLFRVA